MDRFSAETTTSPGPPDSQLVDAPVTMAVDDSSGFSAENTTSPGPPDSQFIDAPVTMAVDDSSGQSVPDVLLGKSGDIAPTEREPSTHPFASVDVTPPPDSDIGGCVATAAELKTVSSTRSSSTTPTITPRSPSPPPPLTAIDEKRVPSFLRSHGKGKREVDIFNYLNRVKDPRFQQLLMHYIRIEANDKSGVAGSLPTAKRPVEISVWTARARPASLPDFTKGKRTFSDFVDSIFVWWGSIQPSWRSFERGKVSREVRGEWDTLYSPCINGLLNVVILAYWWVRILEEQKPEDGVRTHYEQFADDVAWVFSNL